MLSASPRRLLVFAVLFALATNALPLALSGGEAGANLCPNGQCRPHPK